MLVHCTCDQYMAEYQTSNSGNTFKHSQEPLKRLSTRKLGIPWIIMNIHKCKLFTAVHIDCATKLHTLIKFLLFKYVLKYLCLDTITNLTRDSQAVPKQC